MVIWLKKKNQKKIKKENMKNIRRQTLKTHIPVMVGKIWLKFGMPILRKFPQQKWSIIVQALLNYRYTKMMFSLFKSVVHPHQLHLAI